MVNAINPTEAANPVAFLKSVASNAQITVGAAAADSSSSSSDGESSSSYDEDETDYDEEDDYESSDDDSTSSDEEEREDRSNATPRYDPITKRIIQGSMPNGNEKSTKTFSKKTPRICLGNRIATPAELRRFGRKPDEIACIRDVVQCKRGYRFTTDKERAQQAAKGLKRRYFFF